MARRVRTHVAPMLYDGLPDAIKSIRTRKKLQQNEAAARGGLKAKELGKWSDYETRKKRLGEKELPIILRGLDCKEIELWEEKVRLERQHYRQRADAVGEPRPGYDSSLVAGYVESLYRLDIDRLPADEQTWFGDMRNAVAATVANAFMMGDRLKARFRELMHQVPEDV